MKNFKALAAVILLVSSVQSASANEIEEQLESIGTDICTKSLSGEWTQYNASDFAAALSAGKRERAPFCNCVGALFREEGDAEMLRDIQREIIADESYFTLNFTLYDHMTTCLEDPDAGQGGGLGIDLGLSDEDLNVDLFPAESAEASVDEDDIRLCKAAFTGDIPLSMPSFNPDEATKHLKATGQNVDEVCGCAAGYLAAQGDALQAKIAGSSQPQNVYGGALRSGIELCGSY